MHARIEIDYDRCIGCRMCVRSCKYGVFEWLDEVPIVFNPNACVACLECERNCEANAIRIILS
jgi:2-oxoglutarate ferredoxin oxidoreductase subunit delta